MTKEKKDVRAFTNGLNSKHLEPRAGVETAEVVAAEGAG
jgi:hypothetical protein